MRNISTNKDKVVYWAALVTITIVFYVINVLTPLWGDDWHYGFIIDGENWIVKRISSVNEYISTLYNHYLFVNGRGLPDVLQQFWGILESKLFFNICNSLVFFICFYLLSTTFSRGVGNYKEKFKILAISLFSIVVISSGFKETHLWQTGACNYLWVVTSLLGLKTLYDKKHLNRRWWSVLLLYSILCGWSHEAFTLPIAIVAFTKFYGNRPPSRYHQKVILYGFIIGTFLLLFAPGTYHRATTEVGIMSSFSINSLMSLVGKGLYYSRTMYVFFVMIAMVILKQMTFNRWTFAALVSWAIVIYAGKDYGSAHYGVELFSLIALIEGGAHRISFKIIILLYFVTLGLLASAVPYGCRSYENYLSVEKQIKNGQEVILTNHPNIPSILDRYVLYFGYPHSEYLSYKGNITMAKYFNVPKLNIFPVEFFEAVKMGIVTKDIYTKPSLNFYACRWDKQVRPEGEYLLSASPMGDLPILKNMAQYKLKRISITDSEIVNICGQNYAIICKPELLANRIYEVKIYNK